MCCIGLHATGGVIGVILLLVGGCQIGMGIYFQMTPPGFYLASNIWTGVVTGTSGISLMYYGFAKRSSESNYSFLVINLISLLTNILNVVIVQVGENAKFLTEEEKIFINQDTQKPFFDIAIFSSTIVSSLVIISTFAVVQCLFYGHLKRPKKSQVAFVEVLNEGTSKEVSGNRFFPPSRLPSKELIQPLPPLEDVLGLSDPKNALNNSEWVYSSEDKISKGLYPLGLENNPKYIESKPSSRLRNSTFTTPRYARVHHRPQRAQSFASSRDPFSLHGDKNLFRPLPVPIPQLHFATVSGHRIRKSNSFTYNMNENTIALSRKYHAFTLNRDVNYSVIEVGSLKSTDSENSFHHHIDNLSNDSQAQNLLLYAKNTDINENRQIEKQMETSAQRVYKTKGPAPLPPCINTNTFKRNSNNKENVLSSIDEKQCEQYFDKQKEGFDMQKSILQPLTDKSLNDIQETSSTNTGSDVFEEDRDLEENEVVKPSYKSDLLVNSSISTCKASCNASSTDERKNKDNLLKSLEVPEVHCVNNLTEKNEICETSPDLCKIESANQEVSHSISKEFKLFENSNELKNVNHILNIDPRYLPKNACETDCRNSPELPRNMIPKSSKYETVHREIVAEAKFLLENLPNGELQKNKIVLRVPSFKTTGCQTESYRPLRRRASYSQGNIFLNPRYFPPLKETRAISYPKEKAQNVSQVLSVGSSSSSGYSSPEDGSKYASPIQSGPPSPCSSYEAVSEESTNNQEPNVTVIEVNKHSPQPSPYPRILMPSRFRNISDSLYDRNKISTIDENSIQSQDGREQNESEMFSQNIKHLNEAINPIISTITEENERIPRIINAIYKTPKKFSHDSSILSEKDECNSSASSENISFNHFSFPREATYTSSSPSLLETQTYSFSHTESTAAFLASLELLAAHYRTKALANAKQLQIQQTILEQGNLHESLNSPQSSTEENNLV